MRLLETPVSRRVIWLFDEDGKKGKTVFSIWYCKIQGCTKTDVKKKEDFAHMYSINEDTYWFDLQRDTKDNSTVYSLVEKVADGFMTSGKYEGSTK